VLKKSQKRRRTPRRPAPFGYEVERETFDCQRHSISKVSGRALRSLGAPREKMWITRTDRTTGQTFQIFLERVPADPNLINLDLCDMINCGEPRPRLSARFQVSVNYGTQTIYPNWDKAHQRIIRALRLRRGDC
jgi:hypothetical protein